MRSFYFGVYYLVKGGLCLKLLIVDSHMETGELFLDLTKHFEECETVDEGKGAIKLLAHKKFDVVIIRYMLPDMEGVKLASLLKQKISTHLPIFIAVEDPGLDIWQKITKAKALVLPLPMESLDIKRIKQIGNKDKENNATRVLQKTKLKNLEQEIKKREKITKEKEEKIKKKESEIYIPVQPVRKNSRLEKSKHKCHVITIFSPKGGVGKTTTVVNLAALLKTELNMRTCILEFTRQTGNVLGHFELTPTIDVSYWIFRDEWPVEEEIEDMLLWCPNTEIAVLPTQRLYDEDANKTKILPEHIVGIINVLYPHFDCLVIDGGTIVDDVLFQLMALSDHVGMVSVQNLETLQDCHYIPMLMQRRGIDTEKLINILNQVKRHVGISAKDALGIIGTERNHIIHYSKEVEKVPKEKEPFIVRKNNKGKYYKEIKKLAAKLIDHPDLKENGLLNKIKLNIFKRSD